MRTADEGNVSRRAAVRAQPSRDHDKQAEDPRRREFGGCGGDLQRVRDRRPVEHGGRIARSQIACENGRGQGCGAAPNRAADGAQMSTVGSANVVDDAQHGEIQLER
jgi:hypothetical protein